MTTAELKNKIATAANPERFNAVQSTFNYSHIGQSLPLTGASAIYEYVNQQLTGWKEFERLPNELIQCKSYFSNIKNEIIKVVNTHIQTTNANKELTTIWQNSINIYVNPVSHRPPIIPLPYDIPQVEFLLRIYFEMPNYFQGAYNYLLGITADTNNKNILYGAILAYEYTLKDHTDITKRRNAEKSSISKLRTDFQKYLSESENQLSEYLHNANLKYTEYAKKIDNLKTDKESLFSNWFEETKNEKWQKWFDPTVQKIAELEKTYSEKLKLEEPAKYWNNRAKKLRKHGWWALALIILFVGIICCTLGKILWETPETIYASWFDDDKTAAIKWTIVYATLISFMAVAIRAMLKFMFSSFHLARDCEERYTLTYFYLSLLKDSKVNDNDRQLIMQSLFSRAETGLLKDDASPTMPNDMVNRLVSTK